MISRKAKAARSTWREAGGWREARTRRWTFYLSAIAIIRGEVQERRWQSDSDLARGWRMTGSASKAMDVLYIAKASYQRRSAEEEMAVVFWPGSRLADCSKMLYIYIYTQTQLFEVSIWRGFWRGFGEVLERSQRELCRPKPLKNHWFLMVFKWNH